MAKKLRRLHPYVALRAQADGTLRPRFQPGPRERRLGFVNEDLRHPDGRWFSFEEACAFARARLADIDAARKSGRTAPRRPQPARRAVCDLWEAFVRSRAFRGGDGIAGLATATQRAYKSYIKLLAGEPLWHAPVTAVTADLFVNDERGLYRQLVRRHSVGMANGCIAALAAAFTWGLRNGWCNRAGGTPMEHPLRRLGLEKPPERVRVATQDELRALVQASDHVRLNGIALSAIGDAVLTAFFSGQRKGDVLSLIDEGEANGRMRLRQQKTGAGVSIPFSPWHAERLAAARARRAALGLRVQAQTVVIDEATGLPYSDFVFSKQFRLVRDAAIAGIRDAAATPAGGAPVYVVPPCPSLAFSSNARRERIDKPFTFADLRDSCVTWLARSGCSLPEIAAITGHSLRSIHTILKHYLQIDEHLADSAVAKLVAHMEREGLQL